MLADAFAAEHFRAWRNRASLFWAYAFAPLVVLVLGVATQTWMHRAFAKAAPLMKADLGHELTNAVAMGGSPLTQAFFVVGAAALFAGEYRWETWRLLAPRNSRMNLMLGKLGVFGELAALGLVLLALAGLLNGLWGAMLMGQAPSWGEPGPAFAALAATYLVTWIELMTLGAAVALIAVISRSMLGASMAVIAWTVAQAIAQTQIHGEPGWKAMAALPALDADILRHAAGGLARAAAVADTAQPWPMATAFLLLWFAGLAAVAVALFQRQELSRE